MPEETDGFKMLICDPLPTRTLRYRDLGKSPMLLPSLSAIRTVANRATAEKSPRRAGALKQGAPVALLGMTI